MSVILLSSILAQILGILLVNKQQQTEGHSNEVLISGEWTLSYHKHLYLKASLKACEFV